MLEIFQYDFMQRAFIAGIIVSIIAPLIGTFLVVRRYSLMADTLAHVSLVGVALGVILGINPIITAIITSIIASLGIEKIRTAKNIFGESVLALFLTGSLAIASVLISSARGFNTNIFSYLFGSVTTISISDLSYIAVLGLVIIITISALYKEFFLVTFDEELAQVNGIRSRLYNNIMIIMAAITVSLSMRIIGVLLVGALMVIPVITAMQLAKNFLQTILYAIAISFISVITGLFISFYLDLASGGTIVVITLLFFFLSLIVKRKK